MYHKLNKLKKLIKFKIKLNVNDTFIFFIYFQLIEIFSKIWSQNDPRKKFKGPKVLRVLRVPVLNPGVPASMGPRSQVPGPILNPGAPRVPVLNSEVPGPILNPEAPRVPVLKGPRFLENSRKIQFWKFFKIFQAKFLIFFIRSEKILKKFCECFFIFFFFIFCIIFLNFFYQSFCTFLHFLTFCRDFFEILRGNSSKNSTKNFFSLISMNEF